MTNRTCSVTVMSSSGLPGTPMMSASSPAARRPRSSFSMSSAALMVAAAPKGLFLTGTPAVEFTGEDTATGTQPLCFIDHSTHDMRIGYYKDTYLRTDAGWRLRTRAMTFIRRSGEHNSGIPHAHKGAQ